MNVLFLVLDKMLIWVNKLLKFDFLIKYWYIFFVKISDFENLKTLYKNEIYK